MTVLLKNEDVEKVLSMHDCLTALEEAFGDLAEGNAVERPRSHTYSPLGDNRFYMFKSHDGTLPRKGVHALRLSSDIIEERIEHNLKRRIKIPAAPGNKWLGLVLLFSQTSGELLAIMQDGFIQRARVGATSGLAAKHLCLPDTRQVCLFGTGWQAGAQLLALDIVCDIERVKIYSPNRQHRETFTAEMQPVISAQLVSVNNAREAFDQTQLVVCATNSLEPVFDGAWLKEGMHVNSLQGWELDDLTIDRADVIAVRWSQEPSFWIMGDKIPGEVKKHKHLSEQNKLKIQELGQIISGKASGRTDARQITLFGGSGTGGSSGLGLQFAAVGHIVYQKALEMGLGENIPTDWFLEDVNP